MIFRSSRSPQKQETWTRQRCLWVTQYNFGACFANKPNMMMIFIRRANLAPCYVLFLSILRRRKVRRVLRRLRITSRSWCHVLSLISNSAHTPGANIFVLFFSTSAPSRPNLFWITGIKVMISGIAFDRSDRLSPLRTFPYDRFKIYTIVSIVRMELNSIQAIEVDSVDRVVCHRPGSVCIWSFRSSEHYLRRLAMARSGRSWRSCGNQTLSSRSCV